MRIRSCSDRPGSGARRSQTRNAAPPTSSSPSVRASPKPTRARGTRASPSAIPPTRLIHIDADLAELGRNYATELGVAADAKLALAALVEAAKGKRPADRGRLREEIARGRKEFATNWAEQWSSDQFPLRPERILSELRQAAPEDAFIVTDVGWNKNGVGQQFPITVPGTFVTPSGLATMGFGAAAVLGVKMAQPDRQAIALVGDGGFSTNPAVIATAMEAGLNVVWVVMDNSAFGTIAGLEQMHYGSSFGCLFECDGKPYNIDYAAMARSFGAAGVLVESAADTRAGASPGARQQPADVDSGANGKRADADAGPLGHQRHLSPRRVGLRFAAAGLDRGAGLALRASKGKSMHRFVVMPRRDRGVLS